MISTKISFVKLNPENIILLVNDKWKISPSSTFPLCCHLLRTPKFLGQQRSFWFQHSLQFSSSAHLSHDSHVLKAVERPNVVEVLQERGLLEALTSDALKSVCSDANLPPLRVYCGFDPTVESLHLGNLLGIIVLSWFLRCGHKVVALIGGATALVSDPSSKSLERLELDLHTLERNTEGISAVICSILGRVGTDSSFVVLNNYDWWKDVTLLDFLKEVGRYARVGRLESKQSMRLINS